MHIGRWGVCYFVGCVCVCSMCSVVQYCVIHAHECVESHTCVCRASNKMPETFFHSCLLAASRQGFSLMLTVSAKLTGWGALEICSFLPPATSGFVTWLLGSSAHALMLAGQVFLSSELFPSSSEGRFLILVSMRLL